MATPIAPTPTLKGNDADEFVKKMFESPSKKKIAYMKKVRERFKDGNPLIDIL
ncbi:MAG: hypothetical protein FWH29_03145 [Methanobrevibacter sp.]|nr:hypothetical protein [Methanobrevibacter sp.]